MQIPKIKDVDTLNGSANLWLSIYTQPLPLPSLIRLIPAICAYWNAVKSGSNTTTKLMDDQIIYPPFVNCKTMASSRFILLLFVQIHCIIQMLTSKEDLPYPTLSHYRNAASHWTTFHQTILAIHSTLQNCMNVHMDKENIPPVCTQTSTPVRRTVLRSHRNALGIIPKKMGFGVQLPNVTPSKISKKVENCEVSESICSMYKKCTGQLVQIVDNTKRQRCAKCAKLTSYYCAGCKSWFCYTVRLTTSKKSNKEQLHVMHCKVKDKHVEFFNNCFVSKHQDAWQEEDQKISSTLSS